MQNICVGWQIYWPAGNGERYELCQFFTQNKILNVSILAWLTAQVIKTVIVTFREHRLDVRRLMGSGVCPALTQRPYARATSIARLYGFSSPYFAIAALLAVIVMYDATNVRRAAGEQAKVLNYMMENWKSQSPDFFGRQLKELLGHTPLQVLFGALLGIAMGFLV